ncbi:chondroadherin-like [Photinus pyralis]|uniref:LRRCT domain-containing protein n=1 Tax=Photinus pyralis TaxID=7054 RepID=A0A1Y1LS93_PHOPY|nr:chondroadherin-like [Photinus pyralis]
MKQIFLSLSLLVAFARPDRIYENSTELCSKKCACNLSQNNETLYINCEGRGITHTLANWPKHPSSLQATFRNSTITTLDPMPGSDAKEIRLIYSNCKIKYLASGLLENAMNVKYLDLSYNEIEREQLSANVFKGPYNNTVYEPILLEYLDLSYNRLHSLSKNVFIHTPNLKYLNFEGNRLRVMDHVTCLALAKLTQLQDFNLANNRLTEIPHDAVRHFPNLTVINLSHNELDFVPESLGYVAKSLQILNISDNPIIEFEIHTFEGQQNILKIFADNLGELSLIRPRAFTPLRHLEVFKLSHCSKLSEIDEEAFFNVTTLEEVYLNGNNLKTLPTTLLPWDTLRVLNIEDNNFECDCNLYNLTVNFPKIAHMVSCIEPSSQLSVELVTLTNSTCAKTNKRILGALVYGRVRVMRITLTTLIILFILVGTFAMWLAHTKYKMYKRTSGYPFPVVYSPISSNRL